MSRCKWSNNSDEVRNRKNREESRKKRGERMRKKEEEEKGEYMEYCRDVVKSVG